MAKRVFDKYAAKPAIGTGVSQAGSHWKMMAAMRHSPRLAALAARMFHI